jgi:hypothetical protein
VALLLKYLKILTEKAAIHLLPTQVLAAIAAVAEVKNIQKVRNQRKIT